MLPKDRKKTIIISLSVIAVMLLIGLVSKLYLGNNNNSKTNFFFDTVITITLYDEGGEKAIDDCFEIAKKYENLFSKTKMGSDIYRINNSRGGVVKVDPETIYLIEEGMKYSEMSEGVFDITCGKLANIWDADYLTRNSEKLSLPNESLIESSLQSVDYTKILIDKEESTVCLMEKNSAIDLGAIAKGYVADKMKEYLISQGFTQGIINLGGNVITVGPKHNNLNYSIGIQKPFANEGESIDVIQVIDKSVVTSGIYQRYVKDGDKIYHHIIDLSTGYPVDNELNSVTIISDSSLQGDALSTICFCMGLDRGRTFIESIPGVDAIFVTKTDSVIDTRDN